ncbi:Transcription factor MUTE [Hirschfeldia incana]|nr:Transcription factor MUTE [Hirschfeldia incana]
MSHIAVERNRRRQMNEHLKSLRSLTPCFYIKRGDQASIIGGVIEFIKEMQQLVQVLESKKRRKTLNRPSFPYDHQTIEPFILAAATTTNATTRVPFSRIENVMTTSTFKEVGSCCNSPHANVEAKISGSNVVLRVVSRRIEGQLVRIISVLEKLSFQVLHLNISSMEETILYFFVVKIGLECHLSLEELTVEVQKSFVTEVMVSTN